MGLLLGSSLNVLAADADIDSPGMQQLPGSSRPQLPEFPQPSSEERPLLPPVKLWDEKEPFLSIAPTVFVRKVRIVGSTVFSDDELAAITAPYENRVVTSNELQELRLQLTRYYISHGYINSGAVIPDQRITDGLITIHIIEGRLTSLEISGNTKVKTSYISRRLLPPGSAAPLNIDELQRRLQLLDRNPLFKRVNGELGPGLIPGEAILRLKVQEEKPYRFDLGFANNRSPGTGELQLEAHVLHRNLSGRGDSLGLHYGLSEGTDDYSVFYTIPLTPRDLSLMIRYSRNTSTVVEEPFNLIDIESESDTLEVAFRYPVVKTLNREVALSVSGEHRRSETTLLGYPYPDATNGKSTVSVLRFTFDWLNRSQKQVWAARSVVSTGLDIFGATESPSTPDSNFLAWLGQIQWARRIEIIPESQLIFRTDVQLASDNLLPLEKFAVGGANSVRGYRENQLVRDNGLVSSLEYRIPLFRLPLPGISKTSEDGTLQLAFFSDWGRSWNSKIKTPDPENIASMGLGLRWLTSPRMFLSVYYGKTSKDIVNPDDSSLQDHGIHFKFNWQVL